MGVIESRVYGIHRVWRVYGFRRSCMIYVAHGEQLCVKGLSSRGLGLVLRVSLPPTCLPSSLDEFTAIPFLG